MPASAGILLGSGVTTPVRSPVPGRSGALSCHYLAVRFHAEHRFHGSEQEVLAVLVDPSFALGLSLPDLSQPELIDSSDDGTIAVMRLRFQFVGSLDPVARRLIGSGRLAWIQEVRMDRSKAAGSLRFEAEQDPRRLHGSADYKLRAQGGVTVRRLDGELVVAVPGIGRMAERRILPGIVRRLDIEAEAIDDRLAGGG